MLLALTTEQERTNRLETRVNELEEELTAYKVRHIVLINGVAYNMYAFHYLSLQCITYQNTMLLPIYVECKNGTGL